MWLPFRSSHRWSSLPNVAPWSKRTYASIASLMTGLTRRLRHANITARLHAAEASRLPYNCFEFSSCLRIWHWRIQKFGMGSAGGFRLPFPLLSPTSPSLYPFRGRPLKSSLADWRSAVSSPSRSGAEPQPKSNLVHFSLKIWHLVAAVLNNSAENQLTIFHAFLTLKASQQRAFFRISSQPMKL